MKLRIRPVCRCPHRSRRRFAAFFKFATEMAGFQSILRFRLIDFFIYE